MVNYVDTEKYQRLTLDEKVRWHEEAVEDATQRVRLAAERLAKAEIQLVRERVVLMKLRHEQKFGREVSAA